MGLQFTDVKFAQDYERRKLLKLVHFSPSYSKSKGGMGVF